MRPEPTFSGKMESIIPESLRALTRWPKSPRTLGTRLVIPWTIPWFCIAQPFLRITLRHPRWRRFFTPAREGQTRAAFAELKLLFEITMPQNRLTASWSAIKKQENKKKCASSGSLQRSLT